MRCRPAKHLKPILLVTVTAYLVDMLLLFRVSYMGTSDPEAKRVILSHFLGTVVWIQIGIFVKLFAITTLLWVFVRMGLALRNRRQAVMALSLYWLVLLLRHARAWTAPYADILEIRPVPPKLFVMLVESWPGIWLYGLALCALVWLLLRQTASERGLSPKRRGWIWSNRLLTLGLGSWLFYLIGTVPMLPTWLRTPGKDTQQPDVYVIAADSWRADHFECSAQSRLTPRLGKLCEEKGKQYAPAYPAQNRTMGSMSALFTGLYPDDSGIVHMFARAENRDLSDRSLVSRFAEQGYRTVVVSSFAGDIFPRVKLGFQEVYAPRFGFKAVIEDFSLRAHPLLYPFFATTNLGRMLAPGFENFMDLAETVLEAQKAVVVTAVPDDRPLFMTLFVSGPHFPYASSPQAFWRRGNDPIPARYRWYSSIPGEGGHVDPALYPAIRHRYADKVQHMDDVLGTLIEQILESGNSIVILTSDHGEFLYETGDGGHGDHLWGNQGLEVPLVVFDSRRDVPPAPAPATSVVYSLMDVMSVLLGAVAHKQPVVMPARREVYVQSGMIVAAAHPDLLDHYRIPYPAILGVLKVDLAIGDMVVQKTWAETVENGKFRAWITPQWKFVYSPGCAEPRMGMYPRVATATGIPAYSLDAEYPAMVSEAWQRLQGRWPNRVFRRCEDVPYKKTES